MVVATVTAGGLFTMQELTVIGVEDGALLVASDAGERYRIAIDDVLQSRIRQTLTPSNTGKRVSPREIQGHIRSGLSAEEVSRLTGADLDYVERFEGPVLAERAYVVNSALKVAVQIDSALDPLGEEPTTTFGEAIQERLEGLGASDERWASWKDETGWIVKLSFTANEIDHDARWQYDPKRHALAPLNTEAVTLSQNGEITEGLIPRLRVVSPSVEAEESETAPAAVPTSTNDTAPNPEVIPYGRSTSSAESSAAATSAAISRSEERPAENLNQTADLLEALRRRRGEREAAVFVDDFDDSGSSSTPPAAGGASQRATDAPREKRDSESRPTLTSSIWASAARTDTLDGIDTPESESPAPATTQPKPPRRSRAAMPSWDEIVFGARTDDDLA
ncbi:septation protein SepH [Agreia sp. VKM Ac-1783]|uniref:septation protein SepH n=1 Tax=Agreia sp. VKM Ac-1783 TaxID=1938889 RepID=UPI000A2AA892|nr:septation protein SepH [Agreia sp. VKM Ac-1783]SMQ67882.1 Protein of unknown function [Agreia sp. VKM Ac-1783]